MLSLIKKSVVKHQEHQEVICALSKIVMMPAETNIEKEADIVSDFYQLDVFFLREKLLQHPLNLPKRRKS